MVGEAQVSKMSAYPVTLRDKTLFGRENEKCPHQRRHGSNRFSGCCLFLFQCLSRYRRCMYDDAAAFSALPYAKLCLFRCIVLGCVVTPAVNHTAVFGVSGVFVCLLVSGCRGSEVCRSWFLVSFHGSTVLSVVCPCM